MAMCPEDILECLTKAFPDAKIDLIDTAGDNDHYQVTIISKDFEGKSRIAQHQMVYAALGSNMGGRLHALALKTATPDAL